MRLDHRAHIFQNLNGAKDEVELKYNGNITSVRNAIYDTRAAVYHGNGASKVVLLSIFAMCADLFGIICISRIM